MANIYNIGQHRFQTSSTYIGDDIAIDTVAYGPPPGSIATDSNYNFQDLYVQASNKFSINTNYYVKFKIPRPVGFNYTVKVMLCSSDSDHASDIQYINSFLLPSTIPIKDGTVYQVAIYELEDSPAGTPPLATLIDGENVKIGEDGKLLIGSDETSKYNMGVIAKTWDMTSDQDSDNYISETCIFKPHLNTFDKIVFSLVRTTNDANITTVVGDKIYKGYVIDAEIFDCEIKSLKDILVAPIGQSPLSRIGVWGRPGLSMSINGEEVRIGRGGYYELSSIPIEELCIAAEDYANDNFSLDYQYIKNEQ